MSSDSQDSRSVCGVPLGLHPHFWNGGRSRLEIKVDFYEGPVSLSTLLALC